MTPVNYIHHLNSAMKAIHADKQIHALHIAVYMALFTKWNEERFYNPLNIDVKDICNRAGIRSRTTYYKVLSELSALGYIQYAPSGKNSKGTQLKMMNFSVASSDQIQNLSIDAKHAIQLYHNIKTDGKKEAAIAHPNSNEVEEYFKLKKESKELGMKFYLHFQSSGWKRTNNARIIDWKSAADLWIIKSKEILSNEATKKVHNGPRPNGIQPGKQTDYSIPL